MREIVLKKTVFEPDSAKERFQKELGYLLWSGEVPYCIACSIRYKI